MNSFWNGKKVLITGHSGFKGAWLTLWLRQLGAEIQGISLEPSTRPGLLDLFDLTGEITHHIQDIRDATAVSEITVSFRPDIVFHLAAQPLVRLSYKTPVETWSTNVMGSVYVMESLKCLSGPCAAVMVTTDKVYRNREWSYAYREEDSLGGHDPYSSSKAAMEIAVESWRKSYFSNDSAVAVASARAGNVIGGGDFAEDRIIPDIVRSLQNRTPIGVRNPVSTRPWQHVLEPLSGYMELAERLFTAISVQDRISVDRLSAAWNFGPLPEANRSVQQLVESALKIWPGQWEDLSSSDQLHEAQFLSLAIDKASRQLSWYPRWSFERAIAMTIGWYRDVNAGASPRTCSLQQIKEFECDSRN